MIYDLLRDLTDVLAVMPPDHLRRDSLALLDEAVRRDVHFIARHPTTLFQCLWNTAWWYDCPQAANHWEAPHAADVGEPAPWERPGPKLHTVLESWRNIRDREFPDAIWVRSAWPPEIPLGDAQRAMYASGEENVFGIAYAASGQRLAAAACTRVVIWDTSSGAAIWSLSVDAWSIGFSPDERVLATGGYAGTVHIIDALTGEIVNVLHGHSDRVTSVAFSPDGKWLASSSADQTVRIWEVLTGAERQVVRPDVSDYRRGVTGVVFFPDGEQLASASHDGAVRIWKAFSHSSLQVLPTGNCQLNDIAVSPDGCWLAAASHDHTVWLWEVSAPNPPRQLCGHTASVNAIAFSPDSRQLVAGSADGMLRAWQISDGNEVACLRAQQNRLDGAVYTVAFAPSGDLVASSGWDGEVREWRLTRASVERRRRGDIGRVACSVLAQSGSLLATSAPNSAVWLWDLHTGDPIRSFSPCGNVATLAFSHGDTQLASATADDSLQIWDVATGGARVQLSGFEHRVRPLRFSKDGTRLAGAVECEIQIWETKTGDAVACLRGHRELVDCLAFTNDGKLLASGSADRTVRLWNAETGELLVRLEHRDSFSPHELAFSDDGSLLMTRGAYGVHIWSVASQQLIDMASSLEGSDYGSAFPQVNTLIPWRLAVVEGETAVFVKHRFQVAAWLPVALYHPLQSHSANAATNGTWLFVMEGSFA